MQIEATSVKMMLEVLTLWMRVVTDWALGLGFPHTYNNDDDDDDNDGGDDDDVMAIQASNPSTAAQGKEDG